MHVTYSDLCTRKIDFNMEETHLDPSQWSKAGFSAEKT